VLGPQHCGRHHHQQHPGWLVCVGQCQMAATRSRLWVWALVYRECLHGPYSHAWGRSWQQAVPAVHRLLVHQVWRPACMVQRLLLQTCRVPQLQPHAPCQSLTQHQGQR
jgi:hypothetical protein